MRAPSSTAAQVSSQEVSRARINIDSAHVLCSCSFALMITGNLAHSRPRPPRAGGLLIEPHDQGVLTVVLVVARTHPRRAEAEPFVHRDRGLVGDPHLERERQ